MAPKPPKRPSQRIYADYIGVKSTDWVPPTNLPPATPATPASPLTPLGQRTPSPPYPGYSLTVEDRVEQASSSSQAFESQDELPPTDKDERWKYLFEIHPRNVLKECDLESIYDKSNQEQRLIAYAWMQLGQEPNLLPSSRWFTRALDPGQFVDREEWEMWVESTYDHHSKDLRRLLSYWQGVKADDTTESVAKKDVQEDDEPSDEDDDGGVVYDPKVNRDINQSPGQKRFAISPSPPRYSTRLFSKQQAQVQPAGGQQASSPFKKPKQSAPGHLRSASDSAAMVARTPRNTKRASDAVDVVGGAPTSSKRAKRPNEEVTGQRTVREFWGQTCLATNYYDKVHGAHIWPSHAKAKDRRGAMMKQLEIFFGPEATKTLELELAKDEILNIIPLNPHAHALWDDFRFALRPIKDPEADPDCPATMYIQLDWDLGIDCNTGKPRSRSPDDVLQHNYGGDTFKDAELNTSAIFKLTTKDPRPYPLPSFRLLEIQYALHKLVASFRGAGSLKDLFSRRPPRVDPVYGDDAVGSNVTRPEWKERNLRLAVQEGIMDEATAEDWREYYDDLERRSVIAAKRVREWRARTSSPEGQRGGRRDDKQRDRRATSSPSTTDSSDAPSDSPPRLLVRARPRTPSTAVLGLSQPGLSFPSSRQVSAQMPKALSEHASDTEEPQSYIPVSLALRSIPIRSANVGNEPLATDKIRGPVSASTEDASMQKHTQRMDIAPQSVPRPLQKNEENRPIQGR